MDRLAAWMERWRAPLVGLVLLLSAAGAWFTLRLKPEFQAESLLRTDDPALQALRRFEAVFPSVESRFIVGLALPEPYGRGGEALVEDVARRLAAIPGVARVVTPRAAVGGADPTRSRSLRGLLLAGDGRTAAVAAFFDRETWTTEAQDRVFTAVHADLDRLLPRDRYAIVGEPYYRREYVRSLGEDQTTFLPVVLALVVVVLLLVFRRPLWVALPILAVGLTLAWTGGVLGLLGRNLTMLTGALPTLLIAMGVATAIHIVFRFQEELAAGDGGRAAARRTMAGVSLPCFLSAVTTMIGFGSLLLARIPDIQEFGLITAVGVGFSLVIAMVLLPALLGRGRPRPAGASGADLLDRTLAGCHRLARRRPWRILGAGALVLLVATFGVARVDMDAYLTDDMGRETFLFRSYDFFARRLTAVIPLDIVVEAEKPGGLLEGEGREVLARVQEHCARQPFVDKTLSVLDILGDLEAYQPLLARLIRSGGKEGTLRALQELNRTAPIGALTDAEGKVARIFCLLQDIGARRSFRFYDDLAGFVAAQVPAGYRVSAAGVSVLANHVMSSVIEEGARSFLCAFAIIFAVVVILFRSLRTGSLSLVATVVPIYVGIGAMGLLGITIRTSTVIVGSISLGLAIDLSIHLQARYRRERAAGAGPDRALSVALATTGRPILVTATLLVLGFATLVASKFGMTSEFGLVAAITIGAALLTTLLLLPALLQAGFRWQEARCLAPVPALAPTPPA